MLFTFRADGTMVPPMIIYPYKRIRDEIRKSVPKDCGLCVRGQWVDDNGWMTMTKEVFYEYISKVFHPHLIKIGTKLVISLVKGILTSQ